MSKPSWAHAHAWLWNSMVHPMRAGDGAIYAMPGLFPQTHPGFPEFPWVSPRFFSSSVSGVGPCFWLVRARSVSLFLVRHQAPFVVHSPAIAVLGILRILRRHVCRLF